MDHLRPHPEPAVDVPRALGGYEILAPLGRGGMGVVYRARDPRTGGAVALKTVRNVGEGTLAALRREIRALQAVRHPGVVRVLAEGVADGVPWYAMELVEGRPLRACLAVLWRPDASQPTAYGGTALGSEPTATDVGLPPRRRRSDTQPQPFAALPGLESTGAALPDRLREPLALLAALCEPLAHLHAAGLAHRDLTPDNVIVRPDGTPVLVDFGLAAAFQRGAREALAVGGVVVGTAPYIAPEQIRGEVVDARADLYALGCILHEALAGRPPFSGATPAALMSMHLHEPPPLPSALAPWVPPWLDSLVLALLVKHPGGRVGYAGDVAALLRRALGQPDPAFPAYVYRPRLVGRRDELERFDDTVVRLRGGHGGVAVVRGASGVGKTRLAVELATRAAAAGVRVVTAECPPAAGGRGRARAAPLAPLRPWLQAVADRCLERGADETARLLGAHGRVLATFEPALARLPGVAAAPAPAVLTGEGTRARLFHGLRETLTASCEGSPTLLLLDDLQWADELTLRFLASLRAEFFRSTGVLLLATVRAEDEHPLVRELAVATGAEVMQLDRLDDAGVQAMVADMLALPAAPAALAAALGPHGDGMPFHVGEYLRAAVEDGLLTRGRGGAWALAADVAAAQLPSTLHGLLRHRLERLDDADAGLVALAAAIGREFDAALLAEVAGRDPAAVDASLGALIRRHILEEAPGGALRFGHDQLREVAYAALAPAPQRAAHRAVAEALERRHAQLDGGGLEPALAHHWLLAEDPARAVGWLERAGARALEVGAYGDALEHLGRARALADGGIDVPAARRGRWRRWMGEAAWSLGDLDGAGVHFAAALDELEVAAAPSRWGRAADVARRLAGQLRRRPRPPEPDAGEAALAAMRLSYLHYHLGDNLRMAAMILRAVDLADRAAPDAKVAHPYQQLGYVAGLARLPSVARRYFERAQRRAVETADPSNVAVTLYTRGIYELGEGRLAEARALAEQAARRLRELDHPQELECALAVQAHAEHCLGAYGDALRRTRELYESARARDNAMHEAWGAYTMARELLSLGEIDDASGLLEHAEPLARASGDRASLLILLGLRALADVRRGEPALARTTLGLWLELARGATSPVYSVGHGAAAAAEAALRLCDAPGATPADLARARAAAGHTWRYAAVFPVGRAEALAVEAALQARRGRARLAAALARRAQAQARALGQPHEQGLAAQVLAELRRPARG